MKTSIVSKHILSVHQGHELLLRLEAAGLTGELAQKVIESKDNCLAIEMVRRIKNGGKLMSNQKRAHEIMSKDFFGIEEATKHFGVNPTRQQLAILSEIPFSEAVLKQSMDTHILVAVFPLSIFNIRDWMNSRLFPREQLLYEQSWYNSEPFVKERNEVVWRLIRKTPVENSTSKNWQEQQALLGKDDEVPTVQAMTYTIIGHFLATGERLFKNSYIRTSSEFSDGARVCVGRFNPKGLTIYYDWGDGRYDWLGVSSARKL